MKPTRINNNQVLEAQWADNDNPVLPEVKVDLFDIEFMFKVPKSELHKLKNLVSNYFTLRSRYEHADLELRSMYKLQLTVVYKLLKEDAICLHL